MITAPNTQPSGEFIEHKISTIQKCMDWIASANQLEKESDKKVNIQFVSEALEEWEQSPEDCPYLGDAEKWRGYAFGSANAFFIGIYQMDYSIDRIATYLELCLSSLLESQQLHNDFTNAINNLSE